MFALVELTIVGGSFIVLPFAASAFIASILAFYDVAVEIQWAVFVFGGAALFVVMYRWAQKFMRENTMDPGVGADRLVGLTAIVTAAIEPDDTARKGRVSVFGEDWGAVTDVEFVIATGSKVRDRVHERHARRRRAVDRPGHPRHPRRKHMTVIVILIIAIAIVVLAVLVAAVKIVRPVPAGPRRTARQVQDHQGPGSQR